MTKQINKSAAVDSSNTHGALLFEHKSQQI